jgi:hypothetical protein
MEAFAFAARCRCGKPQKNCDSHVAPPKDDKRIVLPPTIEPISYKLDLSLRIQ